MTLRRIVWLNCIIILTVGLFGFFLINLIGTGLAQLLG